MLRLPTWHGHCVPQVDAMVSQAVQEFGGLDILVANAGEAQKQSEKSKGCITLARAGCRRAEACARGVEAMEGDQEQAVPGRAGARCCCCQAQHTLPGASHHDTLPTKCRHCQAL